MPLSGQAPIGAELAERLGVLDIDGRQPPSHRRTLEALYPVGSILVSAALRASTNCPVRGLRLIASAIYDHSPRLRYREILADVHKPLGGEHALS